MPCGVDASFAKCLKRLGYGFLGGFGRRRCISGFCESEEVEEGWTSC